MANRKQKVETVTDFTFLGSKITADGDCSREIIRWQKSYDKPRQCVEKQRHYSPNRGPYSQDYGFPSHHVWLWDWNAEELMPLNCGAGEDSWMSLGPQGVKPVDLFFFFFYFTILYWFCHTSTWIRHGCTRVSHPEPPPTSLPIPSLWVIPVHQPRASCIMHRTWTGDSFHIWYYTCFNAILPNHPTLALSHRVQKTVLYICVSFAVSHTGLSLPSF